MEMGWGHGDGYENGGGVGDEDGDGDGDGMGMRGNIPKYSLGLDLTQRNRWFCINIHI